MRSYIFRVIFWTVCVVALLLAFWRPALRLFFPNPYGQIVEQAVIPYEIDPLLVVAIMRTESHFNAEAVSPKGARGLMQLMPDTAQWAAEQMRLSSFDSDQVDRPDINIAIGVWYLNYLVDAFTGNIAVAIAAYNAGQGNVRRWLDEGIWSGTIATVEEIPFAETRQYIIRVTDGYRLYRLLHRSGHAGYPQLLAK